MADSQNSITTLLPQIIRLYNNTASGFEKISEAVTSNKETISLDLTDENDNINRVFIPSFGFLKNEIERLDKNIQSLSNADSNQSNMRLSDGTFRKVVLNKLKSEANDITSLNTVESFDVRSNWFLESMMNPLLYVSFDVGGQIPSNTEKIISKKFILNLNTQTKINYFNNNFNSNSNIEYTDFLQKLISNGIGYILDEEVIDLPPKELRYNGNFNVLRIQDTVITEEINGVPVEKTKKLIKLNTLNYNDTRSEFLGTISLKVGDSLVINANSKDTRYKILRIDSSTNSIVVDLVEGYRPITIGSNILSIYADQDNNLEAQIPVGFNEYIVIFIKAIDPDSKIPSVNWSPGSAFYTNNLEIVLEDGKSQNLQTYYSNQVTDFGNLLLSMAKDTMPPSIYAVKPNAPVLNSTDFKVLQINKQATDNKIVKDLESLESQKIAISAEIKELDKTIKSKKEAILTKNYKNSTERDSDRNELSSLITDRNSKSELYSSIINDIDATSKNEEITSIKPKFRVRGFFPFPEPKDVTETGKQEVIKFVISYRYLSKDGSANAVEQIEYEDSGVARRGTVPSWQEYQTPVRERGFDEVTNKFFWIKEDVEDAEKINSNMVDIPIRKNEIVEIRVKSISEAGWPNNPALSDWSNTVRVEFPAEIDTTEKATKILNENQAELIRVNLQNELDSIGVNEHLSNAFTNNGKYFAHPPNEILSGFLSEDQSPISLFDKLVEMQTKINQFEEILTKAKGKILVKMLDEDGNEINIKKGQLNNIFAGYYSDLVSDLNVKKGVIISKTYFISIENSNATTLELISRLPGTNTKKVKMSENPAGPPNISSAVYSYYDNDDTYDGSDYDYNNNKKYDLVPIALANPSVADGEIASNPPFQSAQVKSQFIYARFRDVASEETFYSHFQPTSTGEASANQLTNLDDSEYIYERDQADVTSTYNSSEFIWGGSFDGTGRATTDSDFINGDDSIEVHINHPFIYNPDTPANELSKFASLYESITGDSDTVVSAANSATIAKALFRQSKFSNIKSNLELGKQQSIYLYEDFNNTSVKSPSLVDIEALNSGLSASDYRRTVKTSFRDTDQYLLGKKSCGAYLILASDSHESLVVDGKTSLSTKAIEFGSDNAIRIPIIFQYRMTDYSGLGDSGLGNIAGDSTGTTVNVTYSKRMGFDIYDSNENIFSFDIEITAKYKSDNLSLDKIPRRPLQIALDDLRRTVSRLSPTISETSVNN
jgi:hypothetical protein